MENTSTTTHLRPSRSISQTKLQGSLVTTFEDFYLKKDYKAAADFLLQNKQQISSGIFHYNLGTIYSKMNELPAARFHFEKAIKEGFVNSGTLNNLMYVKSQLRVDDISTSTYISDEVINFSLNIPGAAYYSLSLIFLLIGIILLKSKKLIRKVSIALWTIVAMSPLVFLHFYLNTINYAVAFRDIPLYEGPSKVFQEKGKVKAGAKIILGDHKEGWFYVNYPVSLTGWVNKDQLGIY